MHYNQDIQSILYIILMKPKHLIILIWENLDYY